MCSARSFGSSASVSSRLEHAIALFVGDAGQPVVGPQPDAELGVARPAADRHHHLHGPSEMRCELADRVTFGRRLAHETDVALLQIAHAAVNELGRAAAGPAGEIAALDQGDRQAPQRSVAGNAGARDAAADDDQIEALFGQRLQALCSRPE